MLIYQHSANASVVKIEPTVGFGKTNLSLNVGSDFYYQPNIPSYFYFGASYDDYGIGIKIPDGSGSKNDQARGNSSYQDFHFDYYKKQFSTDLYFQNYKGFYYTPRESAGSYYYKNPDLSLQHIGGDVYYTFSNNSYSLSTLMGKSRHQNESGGSWVASFGHHYNSLNSPSEFIPPSLINKYRGLNSLSKITSQHTTATIGWGHNWLGEKWYGGLMFLTGGGPQHITINYFGTTDDKLEWAVEVITKGGFGYQNGNFRTGVGITIQQNDVEVNKESKLQFGGADSLFYLTYIY